MVSVDFLQLTGTLIVGGIVYAACFWLGLKLKL